jgi:hypothetical protein
MEEQGRAIRAIVNGELLSSSSSPADCLLLTADCQLNLRGAGWRGLFAGMAALDKMSPPTGEERTSNFKK